MRQLQESGAERRKGSALVMALCVVIVLSGLGAAFLLVTRSASQRQGAETQDLQAFYLAEAGLAESFQALRIGRSGQVGSEVQPAEHGNGLLWVDAEDTADGQVRLTSTALLGSGRASLALVVEPVVIQLGFFSDEELVVDSVLLVDGFNSDESTYEELVGGLPSVVPGPDDFVHDNVSVKVIRIAQMYYDYSYVEAGAYYYVDSVSRDPIMRTIDARDYFDAKQAADPSIEDPTGVHTDSGGLISSNASVVFTAADSQPVAIFGDVIPGPEGVVAGLLTGQVTGDTTPRTTAVVLPTVELPNVALAAAVRHDDLFPMLVSPGTSGHQRIEVAAGAELILRGPATVVIGDLVLEPGALLTLDTRDGDVEIYVTGGMDLQVGSTVTTSSDYPDELSIQVDAIPSGPEGAPIKLNATSQFHGTLYAPETEVEVGSEFEVYGGIVARKLDIGPGARLHFDGTEHRGSPLPKLVSWRIMQIPAAVRNDRGNPYSVLGIEPGDPLVLAEAHDLASVHLSLTYKDRSNIVQSFYGTEDQFDWSLVAEVLKLEREAERDKLDESSDEVVDEVASVVRIEVQTMIDNRTSDGFPVGGSQFVDNIIQYMPLSGSEWDGILGIPDTMDPDSWDRLVQEDIAAGGTGGN